MYASTSWIMTHQWRRDNKAHTHTIHIYLPITRKSKRWKSHTALKTKARVVKANHNLLCIVLKVNPSKLSHWNPRKKTVWHPRVVHGVMCSGKKWCSVIWLNAMHSDKKYEFENLCSLLYILLKSLLLCCCSLAALATQQQMMSTLPLLCIAICYNNLYKTVFFPNINLLKLLTVHSQTSE